MSELTKQYFDKQLNKLATKEDIRDVKGFVKTEINNLEIKLETKIETEIAELARITKNGLDEVKKELDVRKQVENHNRRIYQIEQALNIKN